MENFKQAIEWLKEGKKVRRKSWDKCCYYYIKEELVEPIFIDCDNKVREDENFIFEDYSATDWEIYGDPELLKQRGER